MWVCSRSAPRARAVWLLTVPSWQPSTSAVSRTDRSSKYRSTTQARCRGGSSRKASSSASRGRNAQVGGAGRPVHGFLRRRQLGAGSPAPHVDGHVDDAPAGVGGQPALALDPRPGDVHPDQRLLHDVGGKLPVARDQVRRPAQPRSSGRREVRELLFVPAAHPRISLRRPADETSCRKGCTACPSDHGDALRTA